MVKVLLQVDAWGARRSKNGFPSPDYRSENLKAKLEKHEIGELIEFTKVNPGDYKNCIMLTLIYSASINPADAVAHAYELGTIAPGNI